MIVIDKCRVAANITEYHIRRGKLIEENKEDNIHKSEALEIR